MTKVKRLVCDARTNEKILQTINACLNQKCDAIDVLISLLDAGIVLREYREEEVDGN